jgi:hypothetical protein
MLDDIKRTLWAAADKHFTKIDEAVELLLQQANVLVEQWSES